MDSYEEIMKIAFQAEEALDEAVIAKFSKRFKDKQIVIAAGEGAKAALAAFEYLISQR